MTTKTGSSTGIDHLNRYPKSLGIGMPASAAIALTMKFGASPM